jgi:DHA1 family multidrug resistance protein-like MFS transporter
VSLKSAKYLVTSSKLILLILMGVAFLFRATNNAYEVFISLFGVKNLHIRTSDVAALLGLAGVIRLTPSWYLSLSHKQDFKRRSVLLFVMLGLGLSFISSLLILIFANSRIFYLISLALYSIASGIVFSSLPTLFAQTSSENRHRRVLYPTIAFSFALLVGPGVESLILALNQDNLVYSLGTLWIAIFFAMVLLGVLWSSIKSLISYDQETLSAKKYLTKQSKNQNIGFYFALFIQLIYELPWILVVSFGAILGESLDNFSSSGVALVFVGFFLVSFTLRLLMAFLNIENHVVKFLLVSFLTTLIGLPLLVVRGKIFLILAMLLLGSAHGITYPLALSSLAITVDQELIPRMMARLTFYVGLSEVVVPFLVSFLLHVVSLRVVYLLIGIPSIPIFVICITLYPKWRVLTTKEHKLSVIDP